MNNIVHTEETHTALPSLSPLDIASNETFSEQVTEMLCPICGRRMFTRSNGALRLKTRILIFDGTYAIAKCRYCRTDVVVPIVMSEMFDRESLPVWNEELDGGT